MNFVATLGASALAVSLACAIVATVASIYGHHAGRRDAIAIGRRAIFQSTLPRSSINPAIFCNVEAISATAIASGKSRPICVSAGMAIKPAAKPIDPCTKLARKSTAAASTYCVSVNSILGAVNLQSFQHLARTGKPAVGFFAIEQHAVSFHIEHAAGAGNQRRLVGAEMGGGG